MLTWTSELLKPRVVPRSQVDAAVRDLIASGIKPEDIRIWKPAKANIAVVVEYD